jgi:hypothetical protein
MREINSIASDSDALNDFLNGGRSGISYDENRNVYVVDPNEFESNLE